MRKALLLAGLIIFFAAPASAQVGYYSADGSTAPSDAATAPAEDGAAPADDTIDMSQDAAAEGGQPEQDIPADHIPQTTQVTSLKKCLDKLSPEDAAEVRLNPIRPYQECLARLSNAAAEKRSLQVSRKKAAAEPVAENARNFSRVTEDDGDDKMDDAAKEAETSSGHWSSKPVSKPAAVREPIEPEGEPGGLPEDSYSDDDDAKPAHKGGFSRFIPDIKPDKSKASFNN